MGRPLGSKNVNPYPKGSHRNVKVYGLDIDRRVLQHFKGMHNRVREGKVSECFWPRTREGYLDFLKEIGPYPENMKKPSIGRKKHAKGYIPGNIEWEEYALNSIKRKGTSYES